MTSGHLALVDIDQIKSFIFAAPYLREIRGSSGILAKLNDPEEPHEVSQRVREQDGELLYAGGGSVLAKFPSSARARGFIDNEANELAIRTVTVQVGNRSCCDLV